MTEDEKNIAVNKKKKEYFEAVFGTAYPEKERIETALNRAHEIRQFEIRLYWQRNLFFWGFILTLFAILGVLLSTEITEKNQYADIKYIIFGITSLGLFINCAWICIAKGSKAWQENWEFHIDFLEDAITGRLYKTSLGEEFFSVSKITQSIIWAFVVFWFTANALAVMNIFPSIQNAAQYFVSILSEPYSWVGAILPILLLSLLPAIIAFGLREHWRTSDKTRPVNRPIEDQKSGKVLMSTRRLNEIHRLYE